MPENITLTIQSTSGEITHQFNSNQPISAVKTVAMAQIQLDPSQAEQYRLVFEGKELDETTTLDGAGVTDGATLLLVLIGATVV